MSKNPDIFESAFNIYKVTSILGEGGAGRVYEVIDSDDNRFALKCLSPDRITSERRKRFKNEIEFCSRHSHENVVIVYDSGYVIIKDTKCPFYVMPIFPKTLRTLINSKIEHNNVLTLFSQLLNGIEAAHLFGVWHRDLKPENCLYNSENSTLVVADFGIAHFEEDIIATEVGTKPTSKMANLLYSSPEQRTKGATVDKRADIYSLGLILNEMFTNEVPQGTGFKKISSVTSSFTYLDDIVERMVQQNPESRFSSIDEVKKELIAQKNEFIARQKLNSKKAEVVPRSKPGTVDPVDLVGIEYENGNLILVLNRRPEPRWIYNFKNNRGGMGFLMGYEPATYRFSENKAIISVKENVVQQLVNSFKSYLEPTTKAYQAELNEQAYMREKESREELQRQIAEAETRERILKNIKI